MKLVYNDKQHAYWLDGVRCRGVTSVAGYPDDEYAINQWRSRHIVIGMAISPALVHRAAAHFDERDKIQDIAEEALVAAKAHEASGRGTANHRITERVDLGLAWIDTPEARAIRVAWTTALNQAGLEIVPEYIERIIVYPDLLIAGRFDRIARYRTTGRLVVVDVKTGENAIKYPHSTSIQLGLYANAPLVTGPLKPTRNDSEWTDTFEPMPDGVHHDHGIVVYLPPEGPGTCHRINIERGWEAARQICFPIIRWRKTDKADLVQPFDPPASRERVTWVRQRVQTIIDAGHEPDLAAIWDTCIVPAPLAVDAVLNDIQVDKLVGWCCGIEALAGLPFEPTDPLYQPFTPTEPTLALTSVADTPSTERLEEARQLVTEAKAILDQFDDTDRTALIAAAGIDPTATMTVDWVRNLRALADETDVEGGGVEFVYGPDGATIQPTPHAETRMVAAAGTRGEARDRAARLAKQAGQLAPRSLAQAATKPLLVALVADGHGTPNNQENTT